MKVIATFDIGTTNVKGVLMDEGGNPLFSRSIRIETLYRGDNAIYIEQNPQDWYDAFCEISRSFFEVYQPMDVAGIVMSGQMQDLILLNSLGDPVMDAILYSDTRAEAEAEEILRIIGRELVERITANAFDGSRPFAKLLWIKRHLPKVFDAASNVLLSAKDYIITRLTGEFVSDVVSCSTAGLMDIENISWQEDWLHQIDLRGVMWPKICFPHHKAAHVTEKAAMETGYAAGTPVFAGSGDAGSATLASGILSDGEFNINLGTSGWVAAISAKPYRSAGVSNLVSMSEDVFINVVPFYNAGNIHAWVTNLLMEGESQEERYKKMEITLQSAKAGSGGLLFLPYLVGERFPVVDADIRGSYTGVGINTSKVDFAMAALEGVAYSIRQGLDAIGRKPTHISLVGGGAQVNLWCQVMADMLDFPVVVFQDAEFMPSMAISAAALIGLGIIENYKEFINEKLHKIEGKRVFHPNCDAAQVYHANYQRFCGLYPALKSLKATN